MKEKVKEGLISLKASMNMLISELTYYFEMIKLSEKNRSTLDQNTREYAEEVLHSVDVALMLLSDMKKHLMNLAPLKKNSREMRVSRSQ